MGPSGGPPEGPRGCYGQATCACALAMFPWISWRLLDGWWDLMASWGYPVHIADIATQPGYDIHSLPWFVDFGPNRNRCFTELKNGGSFQGELLNNQMLSWSSVKLFLCAMAFYVALLVITRGYLGIEMAMTNDCSVWCLDHCQKSSLRIGLLGEHLFRFPHGFPYGIMVLPIKYRAFRQIFPWTNPMMRWRPRGRAGCFW